jgi:hypothetical protein
MTGPPFDRLRVTGFSGACPFVIGRRILPGKLPLNVKKL